MSARVQQAAQAPAPAPAPAVPALLLRKCACGGGSGLLGECEDCKKKRLDLKPRSTASGPSWSRPLTGEEDGDGGAAPEPAAPEPAEPAAAPAEPEAESSDSQDGEETALLVEDDAEQVAAGQMRKSEFLAELRTAVCAAANEALAPTGRNSDNCPYIEHWLGYYGGQSSQYLERAIHKYVPETAGATSARDYIDGVTQRVRQGVERWARTGELTDVPEGVPTTVPGDGGGAGGSAATGESIRFKQRSGAAREASTPAEVQTKLGEGRRLEGGVESRMSSAFGVDFSRVRVHTDSTAGQLSNRFDARAFTVGEHVAFASGEYQPGTLVGDALLAHELAHVVQQRGMGSAAAPQAKGDGEISALEADADNAAVGAVAAIWSRGKAALKDIAANAMPRLKSGLQLQRCPCTRTGARLGARQVSAPSTEHCGGVEWPVQWTLSSATPDTEGWIVQEVNQTFNVTDCDGAAIDVLARSTELVRRGFRTTPSGIPVTAPTNPSLWPFQEAWRVNGGNIFVGNSSTPHSADTYRVPPLGPMAGMPDVKGSVSITGRAEFFDCLRLPGAFATGQPPVTGLPITRSSPTLSGGTGPINHNIRIEWDCCRPDKTTRVVSKTP